ncbi:MAG: hypothetical protein K5739_00015 [Lachnospiraceae bacterium]|nr:hypothetical protein [Lachnospiraceae bacterium]
MKKLYRLGAFLLIGALLICIFVNTFSFDFATRMKAYHRLPKDSVDVVIFGSSHAYRNVDTPIMFEDYGITAYDLGSPGQRLALTYYQMKDDLKTQNPKVVVLEVYMSNGKPRGEIQL